jgi:hypothetical protein
MSLWKRVRGTLETLFQIGLSGPNLKNNAGAIEARNSADSAFTVVRVADAVGSNDALNRTAHKTIDSLVHGVAETSYWEYIRNGDNRVSDIIVWTDITKTTKIRETNITYTVGRVSQVVRKQYDATGTLIQTVTSVITRSAGRVAEKTDTETLRRYYG